MIDSDQSSEEKGPSAKHNLDQITKKNKSHAADESIAKKIQPVDSIKAKVDLKSDKILTLQGIHNTEIKSKPSLPKSPTAQDRLSGTRRAQDGGTKLNKSEPPGLAKANALEKAKLQQQDEAKSNLNNESTVTTKGANKAAIDSKPSKTSQPKTPTTWDRVPGVRRAQASGIKLNNSELRILARADAENMAKSQQPALQKQKIQTPEARAARLRRAQKAGIKLLKSELQIIARAEAEKEAKLQQEKSYKRIESADQLLNKTDSLTAVLPSDEKMIEKNKEPEVVKKTENHRFSRKIPLGLKSKPK